MAIHMMAFRHVQITTIAIILMCNIFHLSYGDSHTCSSAQTDCGGSTIQCNPNEPCDITCATWANVCEKTQINCPENNNCTLVCNGVETCPELTIYAYASSQLSITCTGGIGACENIIAYCPPNTGNTKHCTIIAGDDELYGLDYGGQLLAFYAVNGWNDLDIVHTDSSPQGRTRDQFMYCTSNYSQWCNIPVGTWTCENTQDICNDPPTPEPTTSVPTTDVPTTVIPTTSVPTTSIPTTDNPSTVNTTNNEPETSTKDVATTEPTFDPSLSPVYSPTESPDSNLNGEVDGIFTTYDIVMTKRPNNTGDNYILFIIASAVFIIILVPVAIGCVLFVRKRRGMHQKTHMLTTIASVSESNTGLGNGNDNTLYEMTLDKSPSASNEMNKEVQLTPTLYKERNDLADDDGDEMYTNQDVITKDGNNTTTKGEQMNSEGNVNNSNNINIMEGIDDDMYDGSQINEYTTPTNTCDSKTTQNV